MKVTIIAAALLAISASTASAQYRQYSPDNYSPYIPSAPSNANPYANGSGFIPAPVYPTMPPTYASPPIIQTMPMIVPGSRNSSYR
jgi:hypothetical protein